MSANKSFCSIRWLEINPVNSVIQLSINQVKMIAYDCTQVELITDRFK